MCVVMVVCVVGDLPVFPGPSFQDTALHPVFSVRCALSPYVLNCSLLFALITIVTALSEETQAYFSELCYSSKRWAFINKCFPFLGKTYDSRPLVSSAKVKLCIVKQVLWEYIFKANNEKGGNVLLGNVPISLGWLLLRRINGILAG